MALSGVALLNGLVMITFIAEGGMTPLKTFQCFDLSSG